MSASSRFILVCSTIVFGFLYSVATSMRVSGYFRGAARELADFCHKKDVFCKRNGRILLGIFAIAFVGYFALLRSGVGYIDDISRQIIGHFDWMFRFGRVVTELLNLAIHGVYLIHDRSPLGQLIAMGFLSLAALVMAIAFNKLLQRGGGIVKWYNVAPAMIIVFNPYFLDGIAYKYDSPGMAAAILFPLVPFLFVNAPRLYSVSSLFCVAGVYLSYQSTTGIYIMMAIFAALLKYLSEEWTLSCAAKFCAKSAVLFILATMLSFEVLRLLIVPGNRHRSMDISIGSNAIKNIVLYFSSIPREFNGLWKALCVLAAAAAAFAACRLSKKKLWATLPLFCVALLLAFALSQGGFVFLADYAGAARYKYGFGALLAMLASISVLPLPSLKARWKKALAAAPAVLLAWSFFTYASAFGNAHANQMKMELQYEALVMQDISALFPREEYPQIDIAFFGEMPWSGEVANLAKAYPITEVLVYRRYGRRPGFISGRTMRYFDPSLAPVGGDVGKTTLLLERRYYNLLIDEATGRVIVECKM